MFNDCTTYAELGHTARNALLSARDLAADFDGAGAAALGRLVFFRSALLAGQARRKAALRRDPRSPRMRARDKALLNLAQGARVVLTRGAALVQSATRSGLVHRVERGRCTCEASGACWHLEAVALVERGELAAA